MSVDCKQIVPDDGEAAVMCSLSSAAVSVQSPSDVRPYLHAPGDGPDAPQGPSGPDGGDGGGSDTGLITKTRTKTKKPSLYKVLLLNDDYTPQEFVVFVLERFFNKDIEEATQIMLHVHHKGVGICGVYTFEIAETKVAQVMDFARQHQHPLQCTMEKE